jgi:amino acid adenylation domain-containing protein
MRESVWGAVTVRMMFERPTVGEMVKEMERSQGEEREEERITRRERGERGERGEELSYAQQRLWFLQEMEPLSAAYNMAGAVRLRGALDVGALESALRQIIARHEVLRTVFRQIDGEAVQIVLEQQEWELQKVDLCGLGEEARKEAVEGLIREAAQQPFELSEGPLSRMMLIREKKDQHVLVMVLHHIISDGWSIGIFLQDLAASYEACAAGKSSPLEELPIQYGDFAVWQRERLQGTVLSEQLKYWKRQLAGAPEVLELPTDHPRPKVRSFIGGRQPLGLSKELTDRLRRLGRQESSTLYMILLAAFQTLLYRYTGQTDIVVGTPIANRNRKEIERLIGFFVNTLVLRIGLSAETEFLQLLRRVREMCLSAYANQEVPFEKLVEELQPERSLSHTPLFQVMLVMQDGEMLKLDLPGLSLTQVPLDSETAKFDLTLSLIEQEEGIMGRLEYSTDLFDDETIKRMLMHFETLLEGIVLQPKESLSELPLLTASEREQLLTGWNETQVAYERGLCIHEMFERQVKQTPEATALSFEDEQLSYLELNIRANRLAHYLRRLGVGPEQRVGICLEPSIEILVAILGTLKAGGAYLPLNSSHPKERLAYMLKDAQVEVVLTEERFADSLPPSGLRVISLDAETERLALECPNNLSRQASPENLVYLMFTSGSTGQPKGVGVEHRQLANYLNGILERLQLPPGSSYATVSTFAADLGHTAIYPCLCTGGTLHVISQARVLDAESLSEYFRLHPIDCLKIVPSHLEALQKSKSSEHLLPRRKLILGGEAARRDWVESLQDKALDCLILNHYGPTETTVGVLTHQVEPEQFEQHSNIVPLGRPLANTQVYILDAALQPVPVGVHGELYIGGAGLARGYLGHAALTAEKFIPHPFSDEPGARLYRTGDKARYRRDGNLEFLGRVDRQVKIRGFRIELGEIEAAISKHPAVRQVVVTAHENAAGNKHLCAYVVTSSGLSPTLCQLQDLLRETLPDYMIPASLMLLDALPLNDTGKVDRDRLPRPESTSAETEGDLIAPRTPTEETLAKIWSELLDLEPIGVHDNFFQLGGHSLLATQLLSRTREAFAIELPLRSLFENPTIAGLGEAVERNQLQQSRRLLPKIKTQVRGKETLDHLFASIGNLSNEEARRMLGHDAELLKEVLK